MAQRHTGSIALLPFSQQHSVNKFSAATSFDANWLPPFVSITGCSQLTQFLTSQRTPLSCPRSYRSLNVAIQYRQTEYLTVIMCGQITQFALFYSSSSSNWKLNGRSTAPTTVFHINTTIKLFILYHLLFSVNAHTKGYKRPKIEDMKQKT